jgi:hypothetical protein
METYSRLSSEYAREILASRLQVHPCGVRPMHSYCVPLVSLNKAAIVIENRCHARH